MSREQSAERGQSAARPGGRRQLAAAAKLAAVLALALGALLAIYLVNRGGGNPNAPSTTGSFKVGEPGVGQPAPEIRLAATSGGTFDLAGMRGKTVLLYFQEGITCQPCWDQLTAIEADRAPFRTLGIDRIVSITTDPLDVLRQKAADEGLTDPVLSDPDLAVSRAYNANRYGMMGDSRDGHTFIVVGPTGRILWRADYGGAPNYTMFVPVRRLVADLRTGISD